MWKAVEKNFAAQLDFHVLWMSKNRLMEILDL